MSRKNNLTLLNYINAAKKSSVTLPVNEFCFERFVNANKIIDPSFDYSKATFYVLDYCTGLYTYMSGDFAGYKAGCFLEGGIQHTLSIYSAQDLQLANKEMVPDRLKFLQTIRPENHKDYVFSITTKMKNKGGFDENYLQRSSIISNHKGQPTGSIGFALKIPLFNSNSPVMQLIEKVDLKNPALSKTISQKAYYLNEEHRLFSGREKEVLLYMADGLSSKMIADKLFISEHTVVNHRRNMQSKSNTANAIALVAFAIKNGVI